MSDTWREWEGQVIDGAFQLRRHLGGSDHSVVFLTDRGEGGSQKAAIKFVQADAASADAQLSHWKKVAQLSHPNLIKVYENGRCQLAGMDLFYVLMEYAEENLGQFLPQRALSPAETRDMLEPFLDTLTYLHGQGLAHCRIQPSNILAIDDQLKLSSDTICRIGESGGSLAKPSAYTPPEAANDKIAPARDVWALGMTLVETLTQHPLAVEGTPAQADPQVPDALPEPFLDIVRHCLVRDPRRRWTAAEIAERLNPSAKPAAAAPSAAASATTTAVPALGIPTMPIPEKPAAPKSMTSVDPLSVPLSTVSPLSSTKRQALQNQALAGQSLSSRPYYVVLGLGLALIFGVMLVIPRLRDQNSPAEPTAAAAPAPTSDTQPATPAQVDSPAPAKPQPKSAQKPSAPSMAQPAQRSSLQPAPPGSLQANAAKQAVATGQSPAGAAQESASLRSAVPRTNPAPAAPFVPNREASIAAGVVTPGEVLNQVLPGISQKSRSTIRGTVKVVVKVHVDSSGSVTNAQIGTTGPSRFFADAALQAARQWDFAPAKVDGRNVPSEWLLHFDFTEAHTNVTPMPTKP